MAILSFNTGTTGLVGDQINPRRCTMVTTNSFSEITSPGFINNQNSSGDPILPTDIFSVLYDFNNQTQSGSYGEFQVNYSPSTGFTLSLAQNIQSPIDITKTISQNLIEPDSQNAIKGTFINTVPINDFTDPNELSGVYGTLSLNGLGSVNGIFSGTRGDLNCNSGTYGNSPTYTAAALYGTLNLQNATINGGLMAGCHVQIGADTVSAIDLTNVAAFNAYNITSLTIGSGTHYRGRYEYLFKSEFHFGSYILNAGTAVGSAGDPTKCNAPVVLKARDIQNNRDLFIPAFIQNT